ncbi:Sideroflexin-2 [Nymphon striatum]|nr:Sideroflexin-2 [Nymphon striatum]
MENLLNIDIEQPRWDQQTFVGRLKHFFNITDPRTVLCSNSELEAAKTLVTQHRDKTLPADVTEEQLWHAKKLYDSAFHPDSGEKQNVIGRMSFQVPGGMAITGAMLQFYRTVPAVIFWQWINQSFNALVNFTNRNAESDLTIEKIGIAYVSATTSAVVTAIGLKKLLSVRGGSLLQRFVPFAAVAAANCVNVPLMRQSEISNGIAVMTKDGEKVTHSKVAAAKGISQVVFSRIVMAAPGMMLCPIIMDRLERYRWMQRITPLHAPIQVMIVGCFLLFMTPTACAFFPQKCSINVETLKKWEPEKYKLMERKLEGIKSPISPYLYFNKGL